MLDSIVQNLETSISLYAKAIGYQQPITQAGKEHNNNDPTKKTSTFKQTTNVTSTTTIEQAQTPTIPLIPTVNM